MSATVNAESIRRLFEQVRRGKLTPDDAVQRLRHLPFEDLGFAKVDHHRALRAGMPEVIFGEGKTPLQKAIESEDEDLEELLRFPEVV